MLSVENISKRFGPQVLYQNASFSLGTKERIGIIGPNGSGKSTFFRILTGLETLDEGNVHKPNHYKILLMEQEWHPQKGDSILESALKVHADWYKSKLALTRASHDLEKDPTLMDEYQQAENTFMSFGGYQVEYEIQEILSGLGFSQDQFEQEAVLLSGGWRMRCYLAGLLIQKADLMLLDEPTNHLDMDSVVWFESFLQSYAHSLMIISHDRRLIENISTKILEFSPPKLTLWPYGLKKFETSKTQRMEQIEKEVTHKQREIDKLKNFARRFGAKATKARQAQNKLKTAHHFETEMQRLHEEMPIEASRTSTFSLVLNKRQPKVCVQITKAAFGYDRPLFEIDKLWLESEKKVGVIGDNGVGKTTFLRTLAGEISPTQGEVKVHQGVKVSLFSQHRMEELPLSQKAIDYLIEQSENQPIALIRSVAAGLGLREVDVDKNITVMSGGEKARLSLARILLQKPDLLLLDEPTNHLDLEACDALIQGLQDFDGTVVLVSHNRDFLDSMTNQIIHMHEGKADLHLGNYSEFALAQEQAKSKPSTTPAKTKTTEQKQKPTSKPKKAPNKQKLVKDIAKLEEDLSEYKQELADIDAFLINPGNKDGQDFGEKLKRRERLEDKIEVAESKWLEFHDLLEQL